jgi:uncharacterized membrane protein YkoI
MTASLTAFAALLVSYFGARFGALWVFIMIVMVERPKAPVETAGQTPAQKKMIVRSCGIHRTVLKTAPMMRPAAIAVVLVAAALPAHAEEQARVCLSKSEQRAAISSGQAVTLAQAIRSARGSIQGRGAREVVNAKLCREEKGLVYLLTVLSRDGKVTHMTVDATSGKVVDAL